MKSKGGIQIICERSHGSRNPKEVAMCKRIIIRQCPGVSSKAKLLELRSDSSRRTVFYGRNESLQLNLKQQTFKEQHGTSSSCLLDLRAGSSLGVVMAASSCATKQGGCKRTHVTYQGHSKDAGIHGSSPSSGKGFSHITADPVEHSVTEVVCGSISFPHCWQELFQAEFL